MSPTFGACKKGGSLDSFWARPISIISHTRFASSYTCVFNDCENVSTAVRYVWS